MYKSNSKSDASFWKGRAYVCFFARLKVSFIYVQTKQKERETVNKYIKENVPCHSIYYGQKIENNLKL